MKYVISEKLEKLEVGPPFDYILIFSNIDWFRQNFEIIEICSNGPKLKS